MLTLSITCTRPERAGGWRGKGKREKEREGKDRRGVGGERASREVKMHEPYSCVMSGENSPTHQHEPPDTCMKPTNSRHFPRVPISRKRDRTTTASNTTRPYKPRRCLIRCPLQIPSTHTWLVRSTAQQSSHDPQNVFARFPGTPHSAQKKIVPLSRLFPFFFFRLRINSCKQTTPEQTASAASRQA